MVVFSSAAIILSFMMYIGTVSLFSDPMSIAATIVHVLLLIVFTIKCMSTVAGVVRKGETSKGSLTEAADALTKATSSSSIVLTKASSSSSIVLTKASSSIVLTIVGSVWLLIALLIVALIVVEAIAVVIGTVWLLVSLIVGLIVAIASAVALRGY